MNHLVPFILAGLIGVPIPPDGASIQQFQATPTAVPPGGSVLLTWVAVGTDRVRIEPLGLELPAMSWLKLSLKERTTFWIHAVNAKGGQSIPLGVEVVPPEPPVAAVAIPLPPVAAATPASPAPAPAAALPAPVKPATAPAARARAAAVWIQFAAISDPRRVAMLRKDLKRILGIDTTVVPLQGSPLKLLRVRSGPFPTPSAAKLRIRHFRPKLRRMQLAPFVATD